MSTTTEDEKQLDLADAILDAGRKRVDAERLAEEEQVATSALFSAWEAYSAAHQAALDANRDAHRAGCDVAIAFAERFRSPKWHCTVRDGDMIAEIRHALRGLPDHGKEPD